MRIYISKIIKLVATKRANVIKAVVLGRLVLVRNEVRMNTLLLTNQLLLDQLLNNNKESIGAQNRKYRKRVKWSEFIKDMTKHYFQRMFRIPQECFDSLFLDIEKSVGRSNFINESYLETCPMKTIQKAHLRSNGGLISGEVKLAMTIRILSGGSFHDI